MECSDRRASKIRDIFIGMASDLEVDIIHLQYSSATQRKGQISQMHKTRRNVELHVFLCSVSVMGTHACMYEENEDKVL